MKIIISILFASSVVAVNIPSPSKETKNIAPYLQLNIFKKLKRNHKLVTKLFYRNTIDRNVYGADFSFRRKIDRNVQYGIESDIRSGLRHDDDWVRQSDSEWDWNDESEVEFGSSLFLRYKRELQFLPGRTWIGGLNFKTHNNWTESLLTLIPEVSLTYVHFKNGKPVFNVYSRFQQYIPLNYSEVDVYQNWAYLGLLLHYSKKYKPFIFASTQNVEWTRSKEFKEKRPEEKYDQTHVTRYVGLGLNIYLD